MGDQFLKLHLIWLEMKFNQKSKHDDGTENSDFLA